MVIIGIKARRDTNLPKVISALRAFGALFCASKGWKQKSRQDANDRYHDQQLDQGKCQARTALAARLATAR